MIRNTASSYGSVAKFIHWLMAIMLVGLFIVGNVMTDMDLSPDKLEIYQLHKSFGIAVLALILFRFFWKITNPAPQLPQTMNRFEMIVSQIVHYSFYALILLTPIFGWLMSNYAGYPVSVFGLFTLPDLVAPDQEMNKIFKEWHETLADLIMVLAALHALAALYHYFIKKDRVLQRMGFSKKTAPDA